MIQFFKRSLRAAIPRFLSLALTVVLFFCIFRFDGISKGFRTITEILSPFIYGGVMAFLLKTPFNWIDAKLSSLLPGKHKGLSKPLAVLIVMLLTVVVIYLLLSMVIPSLVDSIIRIVNMAPATLAHFEKWVAEVTKGDEVINNYIDQAVTAIQTNGMTWLQQHVLPRLQRMMGEFASTFSSVFGVLYNVVIGVIICAYILLAKETFARQGKMVVYALFHKDTARAILDEFKFIDKTFVGFFAGKILDSAVVGLICYIFCLIMHFTMGMKNIVLIAVIIGVTNIIPYFGPFIGAIPSALLILIDSPLLCLIFVIFIIILQQFDGNVLGPMLLSESVGLSGFWVLFAITFFGGLMGFTGVLVGVPLFAIIYDLIKRIIYYCLNKKGIKVSEITRTGQGDTPVGTGEAEEKKEAAGS